jgi:hypothetical protein
MKPILKYGFKNTLKYNPKRFVSFSKRVKIIESGRGYLTIFLVTGTVTLTASGFVNGYLESKIWDEIQAEVTKIERESEIKQKITYRYKYRHYLFQKTVEESLSPYWGPSELNEYKVGDLINVRKCQRNPQLTCLRLPLFQPIGSIFFYDFKGEEIKKEKKVNIKITTKNQKKKFPAKYSKINIFVS